jgi:FkbM family methyltransferase
LTNRGFSSVQPFYDLADLVRVDHPLANGWIGPPLTERERQVVLDVMARWDDDVSRAHYLQFLAWRILREEWSFEGAPVTIGNRYFIPEVVSVLHDHETFLDGGAYHGDVSKWFSELVSGQYDQIIAVEPDPLNFSALHLASSSEEREWCLSKRALADYEGYSKFSSGADLASKLSDRGQVYVRSTSIDANFYSLTFLKLHLEGGELAALRGARDMLESQRPIVAATVYHNADGICKTAAWLMKTLENYRFLFRNHGWCGSGAVIYAIPVERTR